MKNIESLIRPNIRSLKAYSSARDEYSGTGGVFLDANENPYGKLNRYPDPRHTLLRNKLGELRSVDPSGIFIGNGSDEVIDLTFRIFCNPGKDKALTFNPTYGMYQVAADINDIELIKVDLKSDFQVDNEAILKQISESDLKLVIICSPNNPTGNIIEDIELIIRNFKGIVLIDEAYIDFSGRDSLVSLINRYPNMIVCQTFSKAFALAGARVGVAYASKEIIDVFYKVKPPYNVSQPDQKAALEALGNAVFIRDSIKMILAEREKLAGELCSLPFVRKVWPSDANFLLVEFDDTEMIYERLRTEDIIVRKRSSQVRNTIRITVGKAAENIRLMNALRRIAGERTDSPSDGVIAIEKNGNQLSLRSSVVARSTSETAIVVNLGLDGEGISCIDTGIGFFDHMLCQLAKHGGFNIDVSVSGDLYVDQHHTVEDVALALGEAFDKALGSRMGIERYGFMLPMDDALAQVAVDFGGRPYLVWNVSFEREMIGGLPTEILQHFFRSFSEKARCNLNIKAEGVDEHHKAEAIFKAFARASAMAVRINGKQTVPSTKGVL